MVHHLKILFLFFSFFFNYEIKKKIQKILLCTTFRLINFLIFLALGIFLIGYLFEWLLGIFLVVLIVTHLD